MSQKNRKTAKSGDLSEESPNPRDPKESQSTESLTILNPADAPAHASFIERKSEFIGDAAHCSTEADTMQFVESIREQHPKARHVAFAAIFSAEQGGASERMSDDGEPSGTAGKPILDALRKSGIGDCVVCATRYFGGVLLGSAGLIRAYSTAASEALRAADRARVVAHTKVEVTVDYPQLTTLDHFLGIVGGQVQQRDYTDVVTSTLLVESSLFERFSNDVREAFQGGVHLTPLEIERVAVPLAG